MKNELRELRIMFEGALILEGLFAALNQEV